MVRITFQMVKFLHTFILIAVLWAFPLAAQSEESGRIHSVTDLGHEFSFYNDGRFATQYLQGQRDVRSWGNLYMIDVSNANLINLLSCDSHLKYTKKDVDFIKKFLQSGGGVTIAASPGENAQNKLCEVFDARFGGAAEAPLSFTGDFSSYSLEKGPGSYLNLKKPSDWTIVLNDAQKRPVVAYKKIGKGHVLLIPRSLLGNRPDAKDPVNASWVTPLLRKITSGKTISPDKPLRGTSLTNQGNSKKVGVLNYHYSDYLEPYFEAMVAIDTKCRPLIQKRMGVPLSDGMASSVGLLATGGGGFSSGATVGLAVFWEDFPKKEHGMIEFLTHESVHSWVLPHPEVWNEPIATYVGDLVMGDAGYREEGDRRIAQVIKRASGIDPTMKLYDLNGNPATSDAPALEGGKKNEIHWGKSFWVMEELRKMDPQFLAKYFQTKRKVVPNKLPGRYNIHDTVLVASIALGKDLFPWFNEHGIKAEREKANFSVNNFPNTQ